MYNHFNLRRTTRRDVSRPSTNPGMQELVFDSSMNAIDSQTLENDEELQFEVIDLSASPDNISDDDVIFSESSASPVPLELSITFEETERISAQHWSPEVVYKRPSWDEINVILDNCNSYLRSRNCFFGSDAVFLCPGGSSMYYTEAGSNGLVWRCNGIVNGVTGQRCCNGSMKAGSSDSFFFNRSLDNRKVLQVIFLWLYRVRRGEMSEMLRVSPKAIRNTLNDWYELIHEDLTWGDVKIDPNDQADAEDSEEETEEEIEEDSETDDHSSDSDYSD
ncbi:hypothetical protein BD560DRAFT_463199 [Blakeslea trispora]|nr:hypothetical protein BD560DRAFT_463199 [Blakeslea trispora]